MTLFEYSVYIYYQMIHWTKYGHDYRRHMPSSGCNELLRPGPCLNIKTVFPKYGDSHVKDKTVGETVLSLTWESLYW